MPSIDPRQMERLMRQMGINTKNLQANLVIIETNEGRLLIKNPQVTEVTIGGQRTFQVIGEVTKEAIINEDDVRLVMEQTGLSHDVAADALKKTNGNIAEAILILKNSSDKRKE
jgi:nascent polypeptide-associated complex subunit alpha